MKAKTKLIATLMAMCLVITLGVFGILAVKTLNMSVGGNITFTADGISFEVSAGEFKTTSGADYTNITSQTGKLQTFAMNTNTKLSDVQDKINSWAGLDLVATESLGDPVLHFSITNLMEDEILSFNPTITLGTNINDNMEILISPAVANIQPLQEEDFTITFRIIDKSINAGLTGENYSGFAINILLSTALVATETSYNGMTLAPTATGATTYKIRNCSTATGDVVIPSFVKVGTTNYPVTEIANNAFEFNENITSITIPNTVIRIGDYAFYWSGLTGELKIPNSVTTIGDAAFFNCGNLTGKLIIPDSVTTIGASAFNGCSGLTSVGIPNSVTTIGEGVFGGCSGLTSVGIPNSVTTIGEGVFGGCSGLTSVEIGNGVTTIGERAFSNCSKLTSITVNATTPPTLGFDNCFDNTNNCPIYVPAGSVNAYKAATNWSEYASRIQAMPA